MVEARWWSPDLEITIIPKRRPSRRLLRIPWMYSSPMFCPAKKRFGASGRGGAEVGEAVGKGGDHGLRAEVGASDADADHEVAVPAQPSGRGADVGHVSFSGVADGSFTHPRKSAPSPVPSSSRETASSASGLSASNFSLTAASAASWILMSIVFIAVGCVWFKRGCGRKCCAVEHKSAFGFLF